MGKSCVEEQPMREQSMVSVAMNKRWRMIAKHWQFYVIIALPITYFILFKYVPMYGILLAFKKYRVTRGIWGSPWVGLNNFSKFFANPSSWQIIWNTFSLSMYALLASIPLAVLLAICLNEVNKRMWKKTVQMVTYAQDIVR
jgi:putative aldouronate transport system permease protein